jgi:carbon monoxide dehydrogenase subunit G
MSSLKVEERFVVEAEVARVWQFLKRPDLVAGCLPGAKLDGQEGGDTFVGTMKVKVGPVLQDFRGRATLTEVDDEQHRMTISGQGDDKAGGGSARLTMQCQVVALESGGSEVSVNADVELAGKLVRFGRGMFEAVAKQLFKQFVERARTAIAAQPVPEPSAKAPVPAPEPSAKAPVPAAEPAAPVEPPATAEPAVTAEPVAQSPAVSAPAIIPAPGAVAAKPAQKEEALDAGSLIFAVIWAWLKGLWRRIF